MKNRTRPFAVLLLITLIAAACGDRDKRIAELENKFAEEKGKKVAQNDVQPAGETKPEGPLPVIEFTEPEFDFGNVKEGQVVEHTFAFKNTGEAPLIISNAQPSCGCTVPEWTKDPVPVGGTGYIKAKFDTKNKQGAQNKAITIYSNAWPKQTVVKFKAMVEARAGNDGPVKK
jgi:hypothetical protein